MTFKEFLLSDGQFGSPTQTVLSFHRLEKRIHTPVKKGTSVGRMMSAGKINNPARPAGITSLNKPMTVPSVLGKS